MFTIIFAICEIFLSTHLKESWYTSWHTGSGANRYFLSLDTSSRNTPVLGDPWETLKTPRTNSDDSVPSTKSIKVDKATHCLRFWSLEWWISTCNNFHFSKNIPSWLNLPEGVLSYRVLFSSWDKRRGVQFAVVGEVFCCCDMHEWTCPVPKSPLNRFEAFVSVVRQEMALV